jgi:hypothetical protein
VTDINILAGRSPVPSSVLVTRDDSLLGDGSFDNPLGIVFPVVTSIQVRLVGTANSDPDPTITYSGSVIHVAGGITYGGIDFTTYPGYVKVILTLDAPVDEKIRIPITGCHFPLPPTAPVGERIFLAVPPIPLQADGLNADASVFQPAFGKASPDLVEVLDVTYQLGIARV